ncbi:ABC transporter substrate-binding protein [Halomonas salipaludis]|uniref:ABC transporter substrate-binding protein n=1 Tax=Halomonas salipaludis TaxID=2032625 RepID=UPI001595AFC9|nr:ABC transporter substrate-binding protein [Halomonas salipaludis]
MPLSKKALMIICVVLALYGCEDASAEKSPDVLAYSWSIVETLVALDLPPRGMTMKKSYETWGSIETLPEEVMEVGFPPNLELVSEISPSFIMIGSDGPALDGRLPEHYATYRTTLYNEDVDRWYEISEFSIDIAKMVGRLELGNEYVGFVENRIDKMKRRVADWEKPLLIIRALDDTHVRVYGKNSLPQAVADRLGLTNAWDGPTNGWGFSIVTAAELVGIEAQLIIVEGPRLSGEMQEKLAGHGIWQHVPSVKEGTVITIPPFWIFGALPSALRFAEALVEALEASSDPEEASTCSTL